MLGKDDLTPRQQVAAWYKENIEYKIGYDEQEFSNFFANVMEIKKEENVDLKQAYTWAYLDFMVSKYYIDQE